MYPDADTRPFRVLLVEDSLLLQDVLGEVLVDIGNVELAGCAQGEAEALDQLALIRVDLAIVDLELNEGSGMGVLRRLGEAPERYGRPRAVVFSSYCQAAVRRHCEALGAEAFFDKGAGLDDLREFVETAASED